MTRGWPAAAVVLLATMLAGAAAAADLDVEARMREGIRLHDAGRFDAAIAVYEEILREQPSNSKVLYEAGYSSLAKRDFEGAARWLDGWANDQSRRWLWLGLGAIAVHGAKSALRSN